MVGVDDVIVDLLVDAGRYRFVLGPRQYAEHVLTARTGQVRSALGFELRENCSGIGAVIAGTKAAEKLSSRLAKIVPLPTMKLISRRG
ncbi:MAG: hypothetical protein ACU85U_10375 [Gammaproteobacteria bacterium]